MMNETKHREIVLAGSGGQGLILSGMLLAEAAILEGKNVVQTQAYGIASRGGLSLAEVILDEEEIIFQQVQKPDCVLALTEEAVRRYETWAARGVPVYYDSTLASAREGEHFHAHPFTRLASELGGAMSVNILALGTIAAGTGVVKMESLERLIRKRFKGDAVELNLKMVAVGRDLAQGGFAGGDALIEEIHDEKTAPKEGDRNLSRDHEAFEVEVNPLHCKDCGYCRAVCRRGVFSRSDRFNPSGYQPALATQPDRCTGCLRCLYICPDFCITVRECETGKR